ncbi:MAG: hypothetical protein E3K37_01530 [Candidatus Kuenenia sp.]|nr:hypothetical protein [Candidatus Kuenenia hertensis]
MVGMKGFKNGEKVLTRRESLDNTGFSWGFRVIGRLYPIHKGKNTLNPFIYKGYKAILHRVGIWEKRRSFTKYKFSYAFVSPVISICYDLYCKVGMLKLLRVLTCKKFPCADIARAVPHEVADFSHMRGCGAILNNLGVSGKKGEKKFGKCTVVFSMGGLK